MLKKIWEFLFPPPLYYEGYNCGCCGKWIHAPRWIPKRKSKGASWWDTVGLCPQCEKG